MEISYLFKFNFLITFMPNRFFRILSFFIFPACVFLLNFFLELFFNISDIYPWIDIPLHFLGGVSIAYMSILFLKDFELKGTIYRRNKLFFILIVVSLVGFAAVLWEFWEYYFSWTVGWIYIYSLEDTLGDLFFGLLGGFAGAIAFRKV